MRKAIVDMLNDDQAEYSLQALIQAQRVVLDTVKALGALQRDENDESFTDEELERLLDKRPPEEDPEG